MSQRVWTMERVKSKKNEIERVVDPKVAIINTEFKNDQKLKLPPMSKTLLIFSINISKKSLFLHFIYIHVYTLILGGPSRQGIDINTDIERARDLGEKGGERN